MKRLLFALSMAILADTATSQTIPNRDFEIWWPAHHYYKPDFQWFTSNPQSLMKYDVLTVWNVLGVSGQAVHIQTAIVPPDTLPAFIFNTAGNAVTPTGGFAYSQLPSAITGYYRYELGSTDTALLWVIFKKEGAIISSDQFKIRGTGSMTTFTQFSFPISLPQSPDTVIIGASSSNILSGTGVTDGSWLELDELEFTGNGTFNPIPGGNFNSWLPQTFNKLSIWDAESDGNDVPGILRTTEAYSGMYAVQLTTMPGADPANIIPTRITTGAFSKYGPPFRGMPFTNAMDTLEGYYIYIPADEDTGYIYVDILRAGTSVGSSRCPLTSTPNYTYFQIPLYATMIPDTMRIEIGSSNYATMATTAGSVLTIDGLKLKSQTLLSVESYAGLNNTVAYPNPVKDILNFRFENNLRGQTEIIIYDITGNISAGGRYDNIPAVVSFETRHLPEGMYFYRIRNNGSTERGKFLKY